MIPVLGYVAGGLGLTSLALGGYAMVLDARLDAANARLNLCHSQRAQLQQSSDDLAAELRRQNAAMDAMAARADELTARAENAAEEASTARARAEKRIAEIMAQVPPKTEMEQCAAALSLLRR